MTVLVTGGRRYTDVACVYRELDELLVQHPDMVVVQGGARGADELARSWAYSRGQPYRTYPADWSLGRRAGIERNQHMLDVESVDLVLAFPGGAGTSDMVRRARAADISIKVVTS